MPVIAPWLRPTNVIEAMHAGAGLGLQARAADQRDAQIAMEAQQQEESARKAAEMLRYHYDALAQARDLAMRDDARADNELTQREKDRAARLLQDKVNSDALAMYREGVLRNQADRNAALGRKLNAPFVAKFHDVGGVPMVEKSPGVLEVADIPGFSPKGTVPRVTLPFDQDNPSAGRFSAFANDPLINRILGTNAPPGTGTNFVAPLPTLKKQIAPTVAKSAAQPAVAVEDLTREEPDTEADDAEAEDMVLDQKTAAEFLKQANGDKQKARQLAKEAGYSF